jgi:regulator of PEP synthase PpsR (kinase-PPPase family)
MHPEIPEDEKGPLVREPATTISLFIIGELKQMSTTEKRPFRTAFFVSDRTGITVEMLGRSLLRRFDSLQFNEITIPYLDTPDKAAAAVGEINERAAVDGVRPLLLSTFENPSIRAVLNSANAFHLDCFGSLIAPLEAELGVDSSPAMGLSHRLGDTADHRRRIDAIRFTLEHDDGVSRRNWAQADIILVGVSRSGKTPTCLYLALQYGVCAGNYPLVPEDFARLRLPEQLENIRGKLFGLSIHPDRLHHMRDERKPGSRYASLDNCQQEVRKAEALMDQEGIPYLDATNKSIEEMAIAVLHHAKLQRKIC